MVNGKACPTYVVLYENIPGRTLLAISVFHAYLILINKC